MWPETFFFRKFVFQGAFTPDFARFRSKWRPGEFEMIEAFTRILTGVLHGPKHDCFLRRNRTNDHEQPRSVPFGPTRSDRFKSCP